MTKLKKTQIVTKPKNSKRDNIKGKLKNLRKEKILMCKKKSKNKHKKHEIS